MTILSCTLIKRKYKLYFYLKVEDSGLGIPQEDQAHIFERFYRVDKSHSREIGGTGLGLAIARNAVIVHRGSIKVHSNEGEGTTFTVRIPLIYTTVPEGVGTTGEIQIIGCIINTYLETYDCDGIKLTEEGKVLQTSHGANYDGYSGIMSF